MATVAESLSTLSLSSSPSSATPAHYLDLRFALPAKAYVGCLACQRDPLARQLDTQVVRCDKVVPVSVAGGGAGGGKKGKKGPTTAAVEQKDEWEVELLDTVLFPEGGGQPSDVGRLIPLSFPSTAVGGAGEGEGTPVEVHQVVRQNLDAVHLVSASIEVGTKVRVEVDWPRRTDLMQQHSGQHLLSAVLEQPPFNLETLSWSLQPFPELSYVELPSTPSASILTATQTRVNELIGEGRKVSVRMELVEEGSGVTLGEKVPENYKNSGDAQGRAPVQRTVSIEGIDENPCCGTHYPSLTPLTQLFISPYTTSIRGTNSRVYFAFGHRALSYLSSTHSFARDAALAVGCAVADLPEKTAALVQSSTEGKRREKRLKEELAGWVGRDVAQKAEREAGEKEGAVRSVALLREDDATNELPFLTAVAGEVATRLAASSSSSSKQLFILACGATAGSPAAVTAGGAVLIFGSDDLATAAGKAVVETFGKERVKGGGKGRWQGKVTGRWEAGDELLLRKIAKDVVEASMTA